MLQRIQSLYLLVAAIALALLFFVKIYKAESNTEPKQLVLMSVTTISTFQSDNSMPVKPEFRVFPFGLNLLLFVLVIITIFWYKNRIQQNLLAKLCMLINTGLLVLLLLTTDKVKALFDAAYTGSYQPGIFLPLISIGMIFLASRAIIKDEALVRAADRLR